VGYTDSLELIVDSVLTDKGREMISKGDGSFKITNFAPTDTEIDYGLFVVGGTDITAPANILNTPILEALTNESVGVESELITISDTKVKYLPTLVVAPTSIAIDEFSNASGAASEATFTITPSIKSSTISPEIVDTLWFVYTNGLFLEVSDYSAYLGVDSAFNYEGYAVDSDSTPNSSGGRNLTCKIKSKPIDDTTWSVYGTGTVGTRTITTIVRAVGATSGMQALVTVTISEKA
jgi:hypothetical protein